MPAKMTIDDSAAITPMELRAKCRRLKLDNACDIVIIDYLQLMRTDIRIESREQTISEISRSLKALFIILLGTSIISPCLFLT